MSKELEASVGITKNLGNFESLKLEARKRIVIDDSEDESVSWTTLWDSVKDQVEDQLKQAGQELG